MANLFEFASLFKKVTTAKALELSLFIEIKKAEKHFIDAQKEQLNEGEDFNGKTIGTYSFATELISKETKPRKPKIAGQPFNFEDTGGFFDGMVLDVFEDKASFWSEDEKTPLLVTRYKNLFGLQDEKLRKVIKSIVLPALLNTIRKDLRLI